MKNNLTKDQQIPSELLRDYIEIVAIEHVNFKPHPFMIGSKHIEIASDKYSGLLGPEVCREYRCYQKGCQVPYDQHTSDKVALVLLKRNCTNKEAAEFLYSLGSPNSDLEVYNKSWAAQHKIDGYVILETPEKFRITAPTIEELDEQEKKQEANNDPR